MFGHTRSYGAIYIWQEIPQLMDSYCWLRPSLLCESWLTSGCNNVTALSLCSPQCTKVQGPFVSCMQTHHFLKVVHYQSIVCTYCSSIKLRITYTYHCVEFHNTLSRRPEQVQQSSEGSVRHAVVMSPQQSREHVLKVRNGQKQENACHSGLMLHSKSFGRVKRVKLSKP